MIAFIKKKKVINSVAVQIASFQIYFKKFIWPYAPGAPFPEGPFHNYWAEFTLGPTFTIGTLAGSELTSICIVLAPTDQHFQSIISFYLRNILKRASSYI